MSRHSSSETEQSQLDSPESENFAARLREERVRIEPHQGRFAARIGITQNKQSFLENATRELRADYLAAVAAAGVDVHYVLTGQRIVGQPLDADAAALLQDFLALSPHMKQIAMTVIGAMREEAEGPPEPAPVTVHDDRAEFQAGEG